MMDSAARFCPLSSDIRPRVQGWKNDSLIALAVLTVHLGFVALLLAMPMEQVRVQEASHFQVTLTDEQAIATGSKTESPEKTPAALPARTQTLQRSSDMVYPATNPDSKPLDAVQPPLTGAEVLHITDRNHAEATGLPAAPRAEASSGSEVGVGTATITQPRFDADYLDNPPPAYPRLSRELHEQGIVTLNVRVTPLGLPAEIQLRTSSQCPRLDQAAIAAVSRWRFVPARRGDQAIEAWVVVPLSFSLRRQQ